MSAWKLLFSRINRIRLHHQLSCGVHSTITAAKDNDAGHHKERKKRDDTDFVDAQQALDLLDLLLFSRDLGATALRDKIYGLLGLSGHEMPAERKRRQSRLSTTLHSAL